MARENGKRERRSGQLRAGGEGESSGSQEEPKNVASVGNQL